MIFYSIEPRSEENYASRRWLVDYLGLYLVKQHYSNYLDKERPGKTIDRWFEFKVEKTDKLGFDFGGMWLQGTLSYENKLEKLSLKFQ